MKEWGHFAIVKVNSTLTLDFLTKEDFSTIHLAFKVSDRQFDTILKRIRTANINYGSAPNLLENGKTNNNDGGHGVYFRDPNGHILELLTKDYVID